MSKKVKQCSRDEFLDSFFATCISGMRDAVIDDLELFNIKPREATEARIDDLLAKVKAEIMVALEDMDYED